MVDVPSSLLPKLRCSLCDGYLSVSPVMVSTESQICGRCFRILPEQAKRKYVRETGLEAVAEILTFPCRYRGQGCAFRVHFDEAEDHERECPHRRFAQTEETYGSNDETDPLIGDALSRERSLSVKCQSKELRLEGKYSLRQNGGLMKYTMDISAGEGRALCLQSEHYIKPVEITVEGALSLRNAPENIYCDIKIKNGSKIASDSEHTYATIKSGYNGCAVAELHRGYCAPHVNGVAGFACKNYARGCTERLSADEVQKHHTDCEYNSFRCPIPDCAWHGILKTAKLHVLQQHPDKVTTAEEATRKSTNRDQSWLMFAHDSIFKCKCFHFDSFVEFLVTYVGSHRKSGSFRYEVRVEAGNRTWRRGAACVGWNGVSLDPGVTLKESELTELTRNKQSWRDGFSFTVRISDGGAMSTSL